jgi:predicted dehydrogenase
MDTSLQPAATPLRVGFLGAGVIAPTHALALKNVPHARLVAICDKDLPKAQALGRKLNVNSVFDSLADMLAHADLDVVHVLLPPSAHAQAAIECIEGDVHILVEKPFCMTGRECEAVEQAASRAGRQVGVNHNMTYLPTILRLFDEVRALRLGAVEHVTIAYNLLMPGIAAGQHGHWMFGGQERLFLEIGSHPLSVICRLLGPVTASATALDGHWKLNNGQSFYDTWQTSMICERGTSQVRLSVGRDYMNAWVYVIAQDGEVYIDLRRNTFRMSEKTRHMRMDNLLDAWKNSRGVISGSLRDLSAYFQGAVGLKPVFELQNISVGGSIGAFYDALVSGRTLPVGAPEGKMVVEACQSVIESGMHFVENQGVDANVAYR